jgi:hypothetical protein
MSTTENPSALAAALAAFQAELPKAAKDNTAKVATKTGGSYTYSYADLSDLSPLVLPLLAKHGLCFLTKPTMVESRFVLHYKLLHTSGEFEEGYWPLVAATCTQQELGSAVTYGRRYSLCAVTGVAPGKDDDDAAAASRRRQPTAGRRSAPPDDYDPGPPPDYDPTPNDTPAAPAPSNGHPAGQDTPEAARAALLKVCARLGLPTDVVGKRYVGEHKTALSVETDPGKIRRFTADVETKAAAERAKAAEKPAEVPA